MAARFQQPSAARNRVSPVRLPAHERSELAGRMAWQVDQADGAVAKDVETGIEHGDRRAFRIEQDMQAATRHILRQMFGQEAGAERGRPLARGSPPSAPATSS